MRGGLAVGPPGLVLASRRATGPGRRWGRCARAKAKDGRRSPGAASCSTASGRPTIGGATAATAWGRSTTSDRASAATTRDLPGAGADRPARTSRSSRPRPPAASRKARPASITPSRSTTAPTASSTGSATRRGRRPAVPAPSHRSVGELVRIHPGFRDAPGVVLHRYGNDADYRVWREWVLGEHGTIAMRSSQRNPTPLFGVGLIDAIPDAAIEAAARRKHPGWPQVKGRVGRLADGRIGRFGWKAQTATLREFVLSAAAVELGLEVPGHAQAADPRVPPLKAPGLDLDRAECDALTAFVRSLPAPKVRAAADPRDDEGPQGGQGRCSSRSAAPSATSRNSAPSRASTATCCSTP